MSLIDAFHNLAKINKIDLPKKANFNPHTIGLISRNLTLKDMIALSATDTNMRNVMMPIIDQKRQELEELIEWLSNLPNPQNYTIEQLDQLKIMNVEENQLTSIPYLNLPNLLLLRLSHNQLTGLSNLNLPNLQELYISNNKLTELLNLNLPNLRILNLDNNPLPENEKSRLKSIYGDKYLI